jgi:hypothetical protein
MNEQKPRLVVWFSCGDASAVTVKLIQAKYADTHDIVIARCVLPEEHEDNDRFAADCEVWFGQKVRNLHSVEYPSCQAVWERKRFMSGIGGAPCTVEMKKAVRWAFEREWQPDLQAFGYTSDEGKRADRFREQNPEVKLLTPLIDAGMTKADCHRMVEAAGIIIPAMYRLGFNNNNCIGCVKATSPVYWNRVRREFPEVFEARARLSREIGCRLVRVKGVRIFLDELDPKAGRGVEPAIDCSLACSDIFRF